MKNQGNRTNVGQEDATASTGSVFCIPTTGNWDFSTRFGEFSSLAKFVSGSQEVASPIRLSCQVRAALFNNK